jgi:hypothetical protein
MAVKRNSVAKVGGAGRVSEIIPEGAEHNINRRSTMKTGNVSYLTDASETLIVLNTSGQGENDDVLLLQDEIIAFVKNILIWK